MFCSESRPLHTYIITIQIMIITALNNWISSIQNTFMLIWGRSWWCTNQWARICWLEWFYIYIYISSPQSDEVYSPPAVCMVSSVLSSFVQALCHHRCSINLSGPVSSYLWCSLCRFNSLNRSRESSRQKKSNGLWCNPGRVRQRWEHEQEGIRCTPSVRLCFFVLGR